jgi:hypothetical protein
MERSVSAGGDRSWSQNFSADVVTIEATPHRPYAAVTFPAGGGSPVTDQYQLGNVRRMDNWGQDGVLVRVVQKVSHTEEVPCASGEHLKRLKQIFDGRGWCFYFITLSFVTQPV